MMFVNKSDLIFSDQALLQKLQSKEPAEKDQAWEHVYKAYYPIIRGLIQKNSGTECDATDIFQDGLLVLHRNISNGSFRKESSIKTYLYTICRNLWLKELDRRDKRVISSSEMIPDPVTSETSDDNWGYLIDTEIVGLLLNELGEDCKSILVEYYFHNRSMAELKDMFSVNSIQAAKNKKWRCMGYLVKLCKERGITPTQRA